MYVLTTSDNKVIQSETGGIVVCENPPLYCGSSRKWRITYTINSGAEDPEHAALLIEAVYGLGLFGESTPAWLSGEVEVVNVDGCYVYDEVEGVITPTPEEYRTGASERTFPVSSYPPLQDSEDPETFGTWVVPFRVIRSGSASGRYRPLPYNTLTPWTATVRLTLEFEEEISSLRIKNSLRNIFVSLADSEPSLYPPPAFPDVSITTVYEPIFEEEGE